MLVKMNYQFFGINGTLYRQKLTNLEDNTMKKIMNTIIGDLNEKKRYRLNERRAKLLPSEYFNVYKELKNYIWKTSGILTIEPLISLVDMLEEAAADNKRVVDITGPDVAAFADEFVRGESSYKELQRKKINEKFNEDNR
jgi:DNA-binding ferritin-like protein (Dps family)